MSLRWKTWIIVLLLLGLAGCSAVRLSYNQGPTFVYWWLDTLFDFEPEQRQPVKDALARWFDWHRATQLPELADWLDELQGLAADKVTPAQVCGTWDALQQRMLRWYEGALPDMAAAARALQPAQLDHLAKKYAKDLDELRRDFVQSDLAERRKKQLERSVERFEMIYGRLSSAQKRQIAAALEVSPFDPARWLAERRQRQADIVDTLRRVSTERLDDAAVVAALRAFGAQAVASPRPAYRVYQERVMQANCSVIAAIHNGASDDQRRHAVERLKDWEEDARALAQERN